MNETQIPEKLVEFAREVCLVAKRYQIDDMTVTFRTGTYSQDMKWPYPVVVSWTQGRHGAADDKMNLTSQVMLQTHVEGPFELENAPETSVMDKMIDAVAETMWNDRDARHGGEWSSRDPKEVVVEQTRATAKAAILAAKRVAEQMHRGRFLR